MKNPILYLQISMVILLAGCSATVTRTAIDCWGDSLTGGDQDGSGVTYPSVLSDLSHYFVYNGGVGGNSSTQIAAREVSARDKYGDIAIIWAGRNNFRQTSIVESDIASMVATLKVPKRYLILSILNSNTPEEWKEQPDYRSIMKLNADLAETYRDHYLDIRTFLVSQYDPNSAADLADHEHDVPPTSLRYDAVHLNAEGYTEVAEEVCTKLQSLGYSKCFPSDQVAFLQTSGR